MNKFKIKSKITKEELLKNGEACTGDIVSELEPMIRRYINARVIWLKKELINSMWSCESPIEQRLAMELHVNKNEPYVIKKCTLLGIKITIINQSKISINKRICRVDFEIKAEKLDSVIVKQFAIECDGHDFHEKTKEQAREDKERERELIKNNYTVIRFTGSEIYNNAYKCTREVFDIIFSHFESR